MARPMEPRPYCQCQSSQLDCRGDSTSWIWRFRSDLPSRFGVSFLVVSVWSSSFLCLLLDLVRIVCTETAISTNCSSRCR